MDNKIHSVFVSLTEMDQIAAQYVHWHQMDHMPEQFRISGLSWGQRFIATPQCLASRAVGEGPIGRCQHLQMYLFDDLDQVMPDFVALGRDLKAQDRHIANPNAPIQASFDVVATHAAPRVLVHPAAAPFRPNHGIYLIVEHVTAWTPVAQAAADELLDLPGVAGLWQVARPNNVGTTVVSIVYLDADPITVSPAIHRTWSRVHGLNGATTQLSGPFRSLFPPPAAWDGEYLDQRAATGRP
ncbi:MAG TPA: hypothetical protein PKV27_13410 [Ilumatobacteraceae bacterium]|nr:hypothetical protein [Ilumatobacteraceae bacterium]